MLSEETNIETLTIQDAKPINKTFSGTTLGGTTLGTTLGHNGNNLAPKKTEIQNKQNGSVPQSGDNNQRKKKNEPGPSSYVIKSSSVRDNGGLDHISSDEEEDEEDYKRGGYCPIKLGMILNKRYEIEKKLGWGHFSTVWLCKDKEKEREVAIKILKSAKNYREAALDEIHILTTIKQADHDDSHCILHLLDNFEVQSPFGTHISMVFEKLGCNLLLLIRIYKYRCIPIPLVKIITKQMLMAVAFLHKCQIIHTDLKPENLMLVGTPDFVKHLSQFVNTDKEKEKEAISKNTEDTERERSISLEKSCQSETNSPLNTNERRIVKKFTPPKTNEELREVFGINNYWKVKVVDLGNACWIFKHFSTDVQTREYRAPEVILGASYSTPIDIWSAACIVFELLTGDQLFKPKESRQFGKDDDHLALIIELLGEQKREHLVIGRYANEFFTPNGDLRKIKKLKYWPLQQVLLEKYKFSATDAKEITEFLLPMLYFNAQKRVTAAKCLQQPWIANVDVNNFESIFS